MKMASGKRYNRPPRPCARGRDEAAPLVSAHLTACLNIFTRLPHHLGAWDALSAWETQQGVRGLLGVRALATRELEGAGLLHHLPSLRYVR